MERGVKWIATENFFLFFCFFLNRNREFIVSFIKLHGRDYSHLFLKLTSTFEAKLECAIGQLENLVLPTQHS